jgi:hypothetical protein
MSQEREQIINGTNPVKMISSGNFPDVQEKKSVIIMGNSSSVGLRDFTETEFE